MTTATDIRNAADKPTLESLMAAKKAEWIANMPAPDDAAAQEARGQDVTDCGAAFRARWQELTGDQI